MKKPQKFTIGSFRGWRRRRRVRWTGWRRPGWKFGGKQNYELRRSLKRLVYCSHYFNSINKEKWKWNSVKLKIRGEIWSSPWLQAEISASAAPQALGSCKAWLCVTFRAFNRSILLKKEQRQGRSPASISFNGKQHIGDGFPGNLMNGWHGRIFCIHGGIRSDAIPLKKSSRS